MYEEWKRLRHSDQKVRWLALTRRTRLRTLPPPTRRRAGSYGLLKTSLGLELGNSSPASLEAQDAKMPACRRRAEAAESPNAWLEWRGQGEGPSGQAGQKGSQRMQRGRQMTVLRGWCTSQRLRRIRPSRVDRPNRKAECAATCLLRLERGKGCKALPIATFNGKQKVGMRLT